MLDFIPEANVGITEFVTHLPRPMHADDVLCAALAQYINPDVIITHVASISENEIAQYERPGVIVADVGRGAFDHHQDNVNVQQNGHKRAAIGLMLESPEIQDLLKQKGIDIMDSKYDDFIMEIGRIEDLDNGLDVSMHEITRFAHYANPVWDSTESPEDAFLQAVQTVREEFLTPFFETGEWSLDDPNHGKMLFDELNLDGEEAFEESQSRAARIIDAALDNAHKRGSDVVVFDRYVPWQSTLPETDANFVIYPSAHGGYNLQCVPPTPNSFDKKIELPDWRENAPDGLIFEHPNAFLANFKTQEQALRAADSIERPAIAQTIDDLESKMLDALPKNQFIIEKDNNQLTITPVKQPSDCSWQMEIKQENNHVMGRIMIDNEYITDLASLKREHDKIFATANQLIKIAKDEQERFVTHDVILR